MRRILAIAALLAALALAAPAARAEQIEVQGKRLSVFGPDSERAACERLAKQGDLALERIAADLGIAIPATRFKIFLYESEAEYVREEGIRTKGLFRTNLAFTYAKDAEVHMVFQPRLGRGPGGEAPGMLEALAMHELSHALQYKVVGAAYDKQPDWLSEGIAELCAERAVGGHDRGIADKVPWFGDFVLDVREALDLGTFLPLERLIREGLQGKNGDVHDRQVRYGQSWALVRMLDAPEDKPRRDRFRQYLREVMDLPDGDDVPARANARFLEMFGTPTKGEGAPSLVSLERDLVKAVRDSPVFPWQIIFRDLRAARDGSLIVESFPESSALAVSTAPPFGPRGKIKATLTIGPGGGEQADLVFSYRAPDDYYKLAFGAAGFVTLMQFDGQWKNIANAKCAPALLAAGTTHELGITVDTGRLYAKVDGQLVFRYALSDKSFGSGRYGIGAYDGRATFKDVSASPF